MMMIKVKIFTDQEEGCKKQSPGTTVDMEVNLKMVSMMKRTVLKTNIIVENDDHDYHDRGNDNDNDDDCDDHACGI